MITTRITTSDRGDFTETTEGAQPSSIEMSRTAKGLWQPSIKIYAGSSPEEMTAALNEIKRLTDMVEAMYEGKLTT